MEIEKRTMNVTDLVKEAAQKSGKTQKELREAIDVLEDVVKDELAKADAKTTVEVKVFSSLVVVSEHVPSRQARNPQTGEVFMTTPKNRVKVKVGKALKDAANA